MTVSSYRELPPAPDLSDVVLAGWSFSGPPEAPLRHTVPPDGCVSVVWTPSGLVVMGPRVAAFVLDLPAAARVPGVRLWPDAARAVLGVSGAALRDVVGPLDVVAPAAAVSWGADGFSAAPDRSALDVGVRAAVVAIVRAGGQAPVASIAREVGWSVRTLERRFGEAVGLSPKAFARIRRFRHALTDIAGNRLPSWARVAAEAGYADQAHLTREVRALTGTSPGDVGRYFATIAHVDVTP